MSSKTMVTEALGLCTLMCPQEEQELRIKNGEVHVLEGFSGSGCRLQMIKRFKRSSAGHNMKIPEHIRTPETLMMTVSYIEQNIMGSSTKSTGKESASLTLNIEYLFIWDRYRMITMDFVLQSYSEESFDSVWIECHERIARWYALMYHRMQKTEEFLSSHSRHHLEGFSNILKSLLTCYDRSFYDEGRCPNAGEFISYSLLLQLCSAAFNDLLHKIPATIVLHSAHVQQTLTLHVAAKRNDYVNFFRIMRQMPPLLAGLAQQYAGEVRSRAILRIANGYLKNCKYPLDTFIELLMFEDATEAVSFLEEFDLSQVAPDESGKVHFVVDRSKVFAKAATHGGSHARFMEKGIDSRLSQLTYEDICLGR
jgi:SAC3/GANP family